MIGPRTHLVQLARQNLHLPLQIAHLLFEERETAFIRRARGQRDDEKQQRPSHCEAGVVAHVEPENSYLLAAACGYCASSLTSTPLVQPKPSCTGYSPPVPSPASRTLYFSTSLPVLQYTRAFSATHLAAMVWARSFSPYLRNPSMATHCSGAQPLG